MEKAVTIGTFDGVHRGHRLVLDTLKKEAEKHGLEAMAISFDRHPLELVAPERAPGNLTSTERKTELIRREGVEPIILPFDEHLRGMSAYEWLEHIYRHYDVRLLVSGYDNTFGHDGRGMQIDDYKKMGDELGIEVIEAPELPGISSSAVRKAVKAGDIAKAIELLGHRPELEGRVAVGFQMGRKIGFPTANIQPPAYALVPPTGVYAAEAYIEDSRQGVPAMVNIGYRPTFKGTAQESRDLTVEAHLIGIDEDLYGKRIRLEWMERIRDERKFGSVEELKEQIRKDMGRMKYKGSSSI